LVQAGQKDFHENYRSPGENDSKPVEENETERDKKNSLAGTGTQWGSKNWGRSPVQEVHQKRQERVVLG